MEAGGKATGNVHSGLYLDMVVTCNPSGMLTSIGLSGSAKTPVISRIRSDR